MDFDLDQIPTIESAGRLGRHPDVDPSIADAYRSYEPGLRTQIASLLGAAGADALLGLRSALRVEGADLAAVPAIRFSDVQRLVSAQAAPGYTFYSDCGPYDYDATCAEACFGFAPENMDPVYCATCDEQKADPTNNPSFNWHFVGTRGSIRYMDREPDVCAGKDAWKWNVGACGECHTSAVFRCHDGYKKYPENDYWTPTICQGIVSCDNTLKVCN
jgi:hypothetical protein